VHAKDARPDHDRLDDVGIMAYPNDFHTPKLPGMGDVDWGRFFSVLSETGYDGAVCVYMLTKGRSKTGRHRSPTARDTCGNMFPDLD
jgi:sugar phosphate isomerase/epimerase